MKINQTMKKLFLLVVVASCWVGISGCDKNTSHDEAPQESDKITLSLASFTAPNGSYSQPVTVTASTDWTVDGVPTWIELSPESGAAGKTTVTIDVAPCEEVEERSAVLVFSAGEDSEELTVSQNPASAILVDPRNFEASYGGDAVTVTVRSNVNYDIHISEEWIYRTESPRALESSTFGFGVAENPTRESRSGLVIFYQTDGFEADTLFVSQEPAPLPEEPEFSIPDVAGMTIKGRVMCGDSPVAGVVVSDGLITAQTDENGIYYLPSGKEMELVFVTLPSGYEFPGGSGCQAFPSFHRELTKPADEVEQHDFELVEVPGGNRRHVMMVFTDLHLAKKRPNTSGNYYDVDQYRDKFKPDIAEEYAAHAGEKVYSLCLGDITWDTFWYTDMSSGMTTVRYQFPQYCEAMSDFPIPVFNVIGNHDNDPKQKGDFYTEGPFKRQIAPTYYSFNIGDVHYIVLDNDQYDDFNDGSRVERLGLDGDSDPQKWQMQWLVEDLKHVDKSKKIVIAMHAPLTTINSSFVTSTSLSGGYRLLTLLMGYDVMIVSGHTHCNRNTSVPNYSNIREHNIAAVCGTWWFNVKSNNNGANYDMCRDGSPSGYKVFTFDGTDVEWYYKATDLPRSEQFAIYDLGSMNETYLETLGWASDEVMLNIWDWDENWTIEATENGTPVTFERCSGKDPVHYTWEQDVLVPAHLPGSPTSTYRTTTTTHLFKAKATQPASTFHVKVTDSFGRSYEKSIERK